ncbi:MAG: hypothetical protein IJD94_05105 [Clostridia bacterium]|nr:hypothetical protein [Clostridia bacterium]
MSERQPANGQFAAKLTKAQKDEIFREYLLVDSVREQRAFVERKRAELRAQGIEVSHCTIQRIIHDKKRMAAYLHSVNEIRDEQMARMWAHAGDAVDVHLDIIRRKDEFGVNMATTPQQSANALLDRIGLKAKKEDEASAVTFNITGGMQLGMPKTRDGEG